MHLFIIDNDTIVRSVIKDYISLIWNSRYYGIGDFELQVPYTRANRKLYQPETLIKRSDKNQIMVVEKIEPLIQTDAPDTLIVTGKSIESWLNRRIIWEQTNYDNAFPCQSIFNLVSKNAVMPGIRRIPNLSIDTSFDDVTESFYAQLKGEYLGDAVTDICKQYGIGWRINYYSSGNPSLFRFELYRGTDNSDYKIISTEKGDLQSSRFTYDTTEYKTVALVGGEGEGTNQREMTAWWGPSVPRGLERREIYIDASDINSTTSDGTITDGTYTKMLHDRGRMELKNVYICKTYCDGEVRNNNISMSLGEIVLVKNNYGDIKKSRIIELLESWGNTGYTRVPTFEDMEDVEE